MHNPESSKYGVVKKPFSRPVYGGELYRDDLNKVSFLYSLRATKDHLDSEAAFPELKAGTWGKGEDALGDLRC